MKFSTIHVDLLPLEKKNSAHYYENLAKGIEEKFLNGTFFFMLTAAHQAALAMFMKFVKQALDSGAQELTISDELANNEDSAGTHLAVSFSYEPNSQDANPQTFIIRSEIKPAGQIGVCQLQDLSFVKSLVLINNLLTASQAGSCDYISDEQATSLLLNRRKDRFAAPSVILAEVIPSLGKMPSTAEVSMALAADARADICPFIVPAAGSSSINIAASERRLSR